MDSKGMILLKEIRLKNGEVLKNVFVDDSAGAVWFPGFFPTRNGSDIVYIALDDISSFSVTESEKNSVYSLVSMTRQR